MRFLPPLVLHGAHRAGEAQIRTHLQHYTDRLRHYPNWSGLDTLLYGLVPPVSREERPVDALPAQGSGAA
jgi:glutathione-regulated potassium-efflux system ancillary protein KefF